MFTTADSIKFHMVNEPDQRPFPHDEVDLDKTMELLFECDNKIETVVNNHRKVINELLYLSRLLLNRNNLSGYEEDDLETLKKKYLSDKPYFPENDKSLDIEQCTE